jgi:hypothetical protein
LDKMIALADGRTATGRSRVARLRFTRVPAYLRKTMEKPRDLELLRRACADRLVALACLIEQRTASMPNEHLLMEQEPAGKVERRQRPGAGGRHPCGPHGGEHRGMTRRDSSARPVLQGARGHHHLADMEAEDAIAAIRGVSGARDPGENPVTRARAKAPGASAHRSTDGTVNFVHGFELPFQPLVHGTEVTHAVVLDPVRDEPLPREGERSHLQRRDAARIRVPSSRRCAGRDVRRRRATIPSSAYPPTFNARVTSRRHTPVGLVRPGTAHVAADARRLLDDEPQA